MIDLSQKLILSLIIKAFFTGAALGVLYEAVRILKMLLEIKESKGKGRIPSFIFLFITDLVFCLIFASSAILLTYNLSGGVFRGCVYFSMSAGLLIYRATLGRLTEKIERAITKLIKKLLRGILRLALIPIRAIFSLYRRLYTLTIGRIIGKIRCRIIAARQRREQASVCESEAEKIEDEEENAKGARGYRKEDRICFGRGRRGDGQGQGGVGEKS